MPTKHGQVNPEGGTFAFVQFFHIDKEVMNDASQPVSESMIGRNSLSSETLVKLHDRCHIKRARLVSKRDGTNTELIRQSLPYNAPKIPDKDRGPMSDGLFFVAFGQSAQKFSDILDNILGHPNSKFTDDLLITNVQGK